MRTTKIEDLIDPTEKNLEWARQTFKSLKKRTQPKWNADRIITQVELHNKKTYKNCDLRTVTESQFSKFMMNSKTKEGKDAYGCVKKQFEYIARYIYDHDIDEGRIPEVLEERKEVNTERKKILEIERSNTKLYLELLDFLKVHKHSVSNMKDRAQGIYKVYRRSTVLPNKIIMGASHIEVNEKAVIVTEHYMHKPKPATDNGKLPFRQLEESYSGCMTKSDSKYILFLKNMSGTALQITLFTNINRTIDQIYTMKGIALGILGDDIYSLPIYYERFDGSLSDLESELDIYDQDRVPDAVLSYIMSKNNF